VTENSVLCSVIILRYTQHEIRVTNGLQFHFTKPVGMSAYLIELISFATVDWIKYGNIK
jgi:hypothetical protein